MALSDVINSINSVVRTNGQRAITGSNLNGVLLAMATYTGDVETTANAALESAGSGGGAFQVLTVSQYLYEGGYVGQISVFSNDMVGATITPMTLVIFGDNSIWAFKSWNVENTSANFVCIEIPRETKNFSKMFGQNTTQLMFSNRPNDQCGYADVTVSKINPTNNNYTVVDVFRVYFDDNQNCYLDKPSILFTPTLISIRSDFAIAFYEKSNSAVSNGDTINFSISYLGGEGRTLSTVPSTDVTQIKTVPLIDNSVQQELPSAQLSILTNTWYKGTSTTLFPYGDGQVGTTFTATNTDISGIAVGSLVAFTDVNVLAYCNAVSTDNTTFSLQIIAQTFVPRIFQVTTVDPNSFALYSGSVGTIVGFVKTLDTVTLVKGNSYIALSPNIQELPMNGDIMLDINGRWSGISKGTSMYGFLQMTLTGINMLPKKLEPFTYAEASYGVVTPQGTYLYAATLEYAQNILQCFIAQAGTHTSGAYEIAIYLIPSNWSGSLTKLGSSGQISFGNNIGLVMNTLSANINISSGISSFPNAFVVALSINYTSGRNLMCKPTLTSQVSNNSLQSISEVSNPPIGLAFSGTYLTPPDTITLTDGTWNRNPQMFPYFGLL